MNCKYKSKIIDVNATLAYVNQQSILLLTLFHVQDHIGRSSEDGAYLHVSGADEETGIPMLTLSQNPQLLLRAALGSCAFLLFCLGDTEMTFLPFIVAMTYLA